MFHNKPILEFNDSEFTAESVLTTDMTSDNRESYSFKATSWSLSHNKSVCSEICP